MGTNAKKVSIQEVEKTFSQVRTFCWMPRIDLYVLREFMIPFSVLLFAFSLLFVIADVFNDLGDFLDAKSPLSTIVSYFVLKIPGNIRFIFPITVLLSCMYTIANFGRHREITAMRASGISLFRCGFAIYGIAFLVMLANFWFNEQVVPECSSQAEMMMEIASHGEAAVQRATSKLQYHSSDRNRSWFFGSFDEDGEQKDVKVKFFRVSPNDSSRKEQYKMIEAKKARYLPNKGWEFDQYIVTDFSDVLHRSHEQSKNEPPLIVGASEIPEEPRVIEKAITPPENLSSTELYLMLMENTHMAKSLRNVYETLLWYRLSFPWICFLCSFLALPLAAKNERSGIFTAIINAVIMIVAYQIFTEIMMISGKNGYLPPCVAGSLPTVSFALYGWFFLIRKAG